MSAQARAKTRLLYLCLSPSFFIHSHTLFISNFLSHSFAVFLTHTLYFTFPSFSPSLSLTHANIYSSLSPSFSECITISLFPVVIEVASFHCYQPFFDNLPVGERVTESRVQFHQRSMCSFCSNSLVPVKYKPKM